MGDKIKESIQYLYGCLTLEEEINLLYATATKKLPYIQLIAVTTAISYDNQKHTAVLKQLLTPQLPVRVRKDELSKAFKKSIGEVNKLSSTIAKEDNVDDESISDVLKALTNIEDCLHDFYAYFIQSKMALHYCSSLPEEIGLTSENLEYLLHILKQDNLKHREMLIETVYFLSKNQQKARDLTPVVKYQNPNAWIQL